VRPDTGCFVLVIRHAEGKDSGIAVHLPCRDYFWDLPNIDKKLLKFDAANYRPVRPSDIRAIILAAQGQGWQPGSTSPQMVFDYDWESLNRRCS
jgi:hypothetical protein